MFVKGSSSQPALGALEVYPEQGTAWSTPRQHENIPGFRKEWGCREEDWKCREGQLSRTEDLTADPKMRMFWDMYTKYCMATLLILLCCLHSHSVCS